MHKPFLGLSCHIRETETRTLKCVKSRCFGFIVIDLSAAIPGGDPGKPPVICTTTFTNPLYPNQDCLTKMLLTPLQGAKKCAFPSQKMQYFKRVL